MKEFADSVLPDVDQYFVGHFHLDKLIEVDGCKSVLRVVPDWLSKREQCSELANMEKLKFFAIKRQSGQFTLINRKSIFAEEEVEVKDFIYMIHKSVSKSYGTFPKSSLKHCKENP
ncbi:MAG: hypothetical protein Ct9H300mP28_13040 [Pseudomonadota bacterium]|nr:MAG: hypothetical protein Ct9H300mP28_13040 [Pseudomonadota bacterium]